MLTTIKAFFGGLLNNIWLIVALALVATLVLQHLTIGSLQRQRDLLQQNVAVIEANRDAWKQTTETLAESLIAQVEERQAAEAAADELAQRLRDIDEHGYAPLRQAIRAAPEAEDGAVAPVLAHAIEALP